MATYKVLKFGDRDGVGSIVQKTSFWGSVTTWTMVPDDKHNGLFDEWVCIESGSSECRDNPYIEIERFYQAQYRTKNHEEL